MAQVRLLKIDATTGVPTEFDQAADDITLNSFTVQGGGPVMSGTGIDLNNQALSDAASVQFNDPTTGFFNATAGNLILDDVMAKERENLMTTAGGISFPVISDVAGEVDALRIPSLAGAPSATPTSGGEGHLVWDSAGDNLYSWDGTAWKNLTAMGSPSYLDNNYTADGAISDRDAVYISGVDEVAQAQADVNATAKAIGFSTAAYADNDPATIRTAGILDGFSGLTAGSRYFLSPSTPGAIQTGVPTGSGEFIVQMGYAKSATEMQIQIMQLGRRA